MISRVLIFSVLFYLTYGYPTGAPPFACESMTPGHNVTGQTEPSPYSLIFSENNDAESSISIVLHSPGQVDFEGFLLVGKKTSDDSIIGQFHNMDPSYSQVINCTVGGTALPLSGLTHNSNAEKFSITAHWIPPTTDGELDMYFTATFVRNTTIFWVDQRFSYLRSSGSSVFASLILISLLPLFVNTF